MIVITGGCGFIGSNLVAHLNWAGIDHIVVSDIVMHNLEDCQFHSFVDPDKLVDWIADNRPSAVVHLGAITDTMRHDAEMFMTNYLFSVQLHNICTRHQIPFIYASSAATYGAGDYGYDDGIDLMKLKPLNVYGWSKHLFDYFVMSSIMRPPLCVGLKFFNVYGPKERHKGNMASVITQRMDDVREGRPVKLFKSHRAEYVDGQQLRDFIYVGDVIRIIRMFLELDKELVGLYNVGTGYARSFRDAMVALGEAFGRRTIKIEYIDMPDSIRTQYQYRTQATIGRLRNIGYKESFTPLETGIRLTVEHDSRIRTAAA